MQKTWPHSTDERGLTLINTSSLVGTRRGMTGSRLNHFRTTPGTNSIRRRNLDQTRVPDTYLETAHLAVSELLAYRIFSNLQKTRGRSKFKSSCPDHLPHYHG